MGVVPFFTKTPAAAFAVGLDFTDEIPADDVTLTSGECTARNRKTEEDVTGVLLASGTECSIDTDNNVARISVEGGTKGVWYEILFLMTCSNGHEIPGKVVLFVDD